MAVNPDKLVVRTSTTLEFARYTGTTLGTYAPFTPRGSVTVTDQRGTVVYSDFSSALGAIATQTADGDRTVGLSFTAYLIPSDTVFDGMNTAYEANEAVSFRITGKERVGTETFAKAYKGFLNNFSFTLNQDGAAEVNVSFVASQTLAVTPPTP